MELTASRRTIQLSMNSTRHSQPRALSLAAAHLVLVDMAVDLSKGKMGAWRVFASLRFIQERV